MTAQEGRRRRAAYVTLIAIYQFVSGALWLIGALGIVVFSAVPIVLAVDDPVGLGVGLAVLCFGMIVSGAFGIARLVVGFGLLNLSPWARWAAVVLAILGLGGFPIGTVIGVLMLIYLLSDEGRAAFEAEH